ncbi:MAG: hypothetical protein DWI00_11075 [Planctomycetota bacterium]|nr:MAG: hypothetical protein DWI00_11075 [Planctomycetota bacterium]
MNYVAPSTDSPTESFTSCGAAPSAFEIIQIAESKETGQIHGIMTACFGSGSPSTLIHRAALESS